MKKLASTRFYGNIRDDMHTEVTLNASGQMARRPGCVAHEIFSQQFRDISPQNTAFKDGYRHPESRHECQTPEAMALPEMPPAVREPEPDPLLFSRAPGFSLRRKTTEGQLYEAFLAAVQAHGPVRVLAEKTRIAFQVRMSFAALMTRRGYLRGHLVLAERREMPCFRKIDTISPRNHVHAFELREAQQLQGDLLNCIGEAYRVGCQEHLRS